MHTLTKTKRDARIVPVHPHGFRVDAKIKYTWHPVQTVYNRCMAAQIRDNIQNGTYRFRAPPKSEAPITPKKRKNLSIVEKKKRTTRIMEYYAQNPTAVKNAKFLADILSIESRAVISALKSLLKCGQLERVLPMDCPLNKYQYALPGQFEKSKDYLTDMLDTLHKHPEGLSKHMMIRKTGKCVPAEIDQIIKRAVRNGIIEYVELWEEQKSNGKYRRLRLYRRKLGV